MSGPMLPKRTRTPRRIEIGTGEPTYPVTAQDYYRQIYFEAIDLMMNAIDQRFDQPSFDTYAKMESLLKGLGHAILGNFSTDRMVIELTKISK